MIKKQNRFRNRRIIGIFLVGILATITVLSNQDLWRKNTNNPVNGSVVSSEIVKTLDTLEVKGRAPKTDYSRKQFGDGWQKDSSGCDTRNRILKRDLKNTTENSKCQILTGTLEDPYTGKNIEFSRSKNPSAVQIDHVVALSDAWQKGAQQLSAEKRVEIANDPLNLLAVDGPANQQKSDGDAATWLPANKNFRCEYVKRQVSVKKKYTLWVTQAEKDAIKSVLASC